MSEWRTAMIDLRFPHPIDVEQVPFLDEEI
jgi:hypothetical protein